MKIISNMLVFLFAVVVHLSAQEEEIFTNKAAREQEEMTRKEKREFRKQEREERFKKAHKALRRRDFVFKAHVLRFDRQPSLDVSSRVNFVAMKNGIVYIQFAEERAQPGLNGLGGITIKAKPSKIQLNEDETGDVYMFLNVRGSTGHYDLRVNLTHNSNRARVTVKSIGDHTERTYEGTVYPEEEAQYLLSRFAY